MRKHTLFAICLITLGLGFWGQFGCQTSLAQTTEVSQTDGPPNRGYSKAYFYDGNGNLEYKCRALSVQSNYSILPTVTAASNANPVSITSTAHGFNTNFTPKITISGAVSGWSTANGVWTATITGANTFTIPLDSTAFGTFSGQAWVVITYSPRLTLPIWAVQKFFYTGGLLSESLWSGGLSQSNSICSNRTSLSYQ